MGRVYAVASGKGGVGKTTTVANLGAALAAGGHEAVVVDVDLGMGNLARVLGVDADAGPTVHDVLAGRATATEATREGPVGLSVLAASDDLDDFGTANPTNLSTLLDGLDAETVLLDTSAGLSHDSVEPLRVADDVLLVTTAEAGALDDTAKTREVTDRFETPVAGAVVTRVDADASDEAVRRVTNRLGVSVRGAIPDDDAVAAAAEAGQPLVVAAPDAAATQAYRELAADLVGDESLVPLTDDETEVEPGETEIESDAESADEPGSKRTGFLRWLLP